MNKVVKNLVASFTGQIVTVVLGLIIPRLILTSFGSDINGLLNSTAQLFAYIALLEAGVGTATLQALYSPVSRKDHDKVNGILAATNHFYKRTGIIYFFCVLILSIGYPLVVKTGIPTLIIVLVILLQGMSGVLNYFFQGKFRILLQAEGKNYILTNLATIVQVLVGFGKVIVIALGFDIVAVQTVYFIVNVGQMVFIVGYIKRRYKWIDLSVKPNFESISQKYDVLVNQISSLVFNNTDILLLTIFGNLKIVSVYSVYLMLCNMINTVIDNISASITFKFGFLYSNNLELFKKVQKIFERYYLCTVFWLYSVAYVFLIPFLKLYTKGVTDIDYLDYRLPVLFVLMQLLSYSKRPFNQVVNMAQRFKETKWRSVVEAIINLLVSTIAVPKFGIYGVLIGSIVALGYRLVDLIIYTNKIMNVSNSSSIINICVDAVVFLVVAVIGHFCVKEFAEYMSLFLTAAMTTVLAGILFISANSLISIQDTKDTISLLKK